MALLLLIGLVLFFWGCFLFHVISKLKIMETKVRVPLQREVDRHVQKLRQAMDVSNAREMFLAALSHELRTPLSGVSGAVQLLQETDMNPRQQEYLRMISYANGTLLEVVDDMLNYSRIQAGKIQVERLPFSVRAIIDDMLSLQTIQAENRGIALIRDISADVPAIVMGDRGKLNQILLNIIGNAIKFTDEGSVTVTVVLQDTPTEDHVRLCFKVTDTGIGIQQQYCEDVFTPFTQIGDTQESRRGGTGLGLAICQRLVQAMDGQIHLDSVLGQGSCLTFSLDFDRAPELPVSVCAQALAPHAELQPSLTVLVVEDDEINRLVCTRYLALKGHHPLVAADSRQVLHIMQSMSYAPDAILMDMNLPGITGVDLTKKIRQLDGGRWKQVPVIIMSADVSGATLERSLLAGMAGFLAKPFTASQLSASLSAVVASDDMAPLLEEVHSGRLHLHADIDGSLLDAVYLDEEIAVLGVDTLLELLNLFRAGVATRIREMMDDVGRLKWQAVAGGAHQLQGSAGNLGMVQVVGLARALHQNTQAATRLCEFQAIDWITELETSCHASCDALRHRLLAANHKHIAFVAHSND